MGFRARRSIKLAPGVTMTLSKSGVSYSAGTKGYRVTKTVSGVQRTASIPGTGISHTKSVSGGRPAASTPSCQPPKTGWLAPKGSHRLQHASPSPQLKPASAARVGGRQGVLEPRHEVLHPSHSTVRRRSTRVHDHRGLLSWSPRPAAVSTGCSAPFARPLLLHSRTGPCGSRHESPATPRRRLEVARHRDRAAVGVYDKVKRRLSLSEDAVQVVLRRVKKPAGRAADDDWSQKGRTGA